jgi:hypothetical protein
MTVVLSEELSDALNARSSPELEDVKILEIIDVYGEELE